MKKDLSEKGARISIPARTALFMAGGYFRRKFFDQVKAVAFIILYLIIFRVLVLGGALVDALEFAFEIGLLVLGLTFFLEGLFLGLMPLGEKVGLVLPSKARLPTILLFSVLLGSGATLAEPAISALRSAGINSVPWETPLLYSLLELHPGMLVGAVAIGVGLAVALGILRFFYSLSLKPFIYVIIPLLLGFSAFFTMDPDMVSILGLAWDTGAVTTGVVTVPLILALGLGVARASGSIKGTGGGFGVVMLASAIPILAVLILSAVLAPQMPRIGTEASFFSPANRARSEAYLGGEAALRRLAFTRGSEAGRLAYFGSPVARDAALDRLAAAPASVLGDYALQDWLERRASAYERDRVRGRLVQAQAKSERAILPVVKEEAGLAVRAILPLTALLLVMLYILLRSRPRYQDQVVLGIALACVGMVLLTTGIRSGLTPLGDGVGKELPALLDSAPRERVLKNFQTNVLIQGFGQDSKKALFLPIQDASGPRLLPWRPENHDPVRRTYRIPESRTFERVLPLLGTLLVLLFAFGMGYGSTLAEPALGALGKTVEEITVGTVGSRGIVRAVSVGVGLGLVAGVSRILYDYPLVYILVPVYLLLLALTVFSDEEFTSIAWDSGGVTTGVVTVPLVLALGLGIGGRAGASDGFGILASASAFPILTVLLYGMSIRIRQRRLIHSGSPEEEEG